MDKELEIEENSYFWNEELEIIEASKPEVAAQTFGADAESEAEVQDAVDDNAAHISGEVAAEKASADQ